MADSIHILLVDSEPVVPSALCRILENHGYSLTRVNDGNDAVQRIRRDPSLQLVLLDSGLASNMDGPETAKAILAERRIPIVFLSSSSRKNTVEKVRGITRYGFIDKKSGSQVFLSSIELALEMSATHEHIRDNERRLAHLFQCSPFAILVLDADDHLIDCNREFTRMFQYQLEEARGRLINELIVPSQLSEEGNELSKKVTAGNPIYRETTRCRKDGTLVEVAITGAPIDLDIGRVIYGIYQDIGERKAAQSRIKELLSEKDLLLREVYHRVKNNMHSISVLLSLQAEGSGLPEVEAAMNDARSRVASLQMVYDKLFSSEDFCRVSSLEYLGDLVDSIVLSSSVASRISLQRKLHNLPLDADTLFPLGLILNEALTNAFKYAFPDNRPGKVAVEFVSDGQGYCELVVDDDGIGMNSPQNTLGKGNSTGFGLTLIHALADQLGGRAELSGSRAWSQAPEKLHGSRVAVRFPCQSLQPQDQSREGSSEN